MIFCYPLIVFMNVAMLIRWQFAVVYANIRFICHVSYDVYFIACYFYCLFDNLFSGNNQSSTTNKRFGPRSQAEYAEELKYWT